MASGPHPAPETSPTGVGAQPPPPKPPDFVAGTFLPVTHDLSLDQTVIALTTKVNASLTASVTQTGPSLFRVKSIGVYNYVLKTVTSGGVSANAEPPAGHDQGASPHQPVLVGSQIWVQELVGTSDGVTPITVKAGQLIDVTVELDVTGGALPVGVAPGPISATLTLNGGSFTKEAALAGTYLGVNPNSPVGQKWAKKGGEGYFGTVKTNEQPSPNGAGIIQEFANYTLYEPSPTVAVSCLRAAVWAKWLTLENQTDAFGTAVWNVIGLPVDDTVSTAEGGYAQQFQFGVIVVRANGLAWAVHGAIYTTYLTLGDPTNANETLTGGYPVSDEGFAGGATSGTWRVSTFDTAEIYWSAATGANEVYGVIRDHWRANLFLGFPLSSEAPAAGGKGSFIVFQSGVIYQSTAGVFAVQGAILDAWTQMGGASGPFGFPASDEQPWTAAPPQGPGRISSFQCGQIAWRASDGQIVKLPQTVTVAPKAVTTPDGTALGGSVSLTLNSLGEYTFACHMHSSGLASYDFTVRAAFTSSLVAVLVFQHSGHVEGTDATTPTHAPNRNDDYSETDVHPLISFFWPNADFAAGTLWVTKDYSVDGLVGFVQDLSKLFLDVTVGAASLGIGLVLCVGREIGQIFSNLGEGGALGFIAGMAVFSLTGGFTIGVLVDIAGSVVTNALINSTPINDDLYSKCNVVFQGTLPPAGDIFITDLNLFSGRAFTVPGADSKIYINLGKYYSDAAHAFPDSYPVVNQLMVHELTHAWQIKHHDVTPIFICDAIVAQADKQVAGHDVYQYGPPSSKWSDFGVEGQGAVVDQWFGGIAVVNAPLRYQNWIGMPDSKNPNLPQNDPYFGFIHNNIRANQA